MLTTEGLEGRRELIRTGDLAILLGHLRARAGPVLERPPIVPDVKAALSVSGGICPECQGPLAFDPWESEQHRCAVCGTRTKGERHHAHWARSQHLWLAERAAHLAAVAVFADDEAAASRSREILAAYRERYFACPNRDNVLGPSHLFFSTYLESMWVLNYLGAAQLLRIRGWLPDDELEAVSAIADEAAGVIADFNEGMSNRQTWNSAALTAIAVWFGDTELASASIDSRTGLLGHLTEGFGDDGMWYEGENYHLFAMRGLLVGLEWARAAGVDLLANEELADHFGDALIAPASSALPDLTFPARRDARFGVSLAHPAYLECWEAGLAALGEGAPQELVPWLHAAYGAPRRPHATYDAYLHDADAPPRDTTSRTDLSWWMLVGMTPTLPPDTVPWRPVSTLLPAQGLAVLRRGSRYVSLECGGAPGGHGHADQLHLTLHDEGVHWLADPGTGSYVTPDLFWYRGALAHNAPRLTGQPSDDARGVVQAFEAGDDLGWIQGQCQGVTRSIIDTQGWLLDVVEFSGEEADTLELPWHIDGELSHTLDGTWVPDGLDAPDVDRAQRFEPAKPGALLIRATMSDRTVGVWLLGGTLLRAECPGRPGVGGRRPMLMVRASGTSARLVAAVDFDGGLAGLSSARGDILLETEGGPTTVTVLPQSAKISTEGRSRTLGGGIPAPPEPARLIVRTNRDEAVVAEAVRVDDPPLHDGTLDGFDVSAPLHLGEELRYRRSEEPYGGPDLFDATAYVNWDERAVHVGVAVRKPEVVLRGPEAPPLELDNDPDDIHADGIQIYVRQPGGKRIGFLVRPTENGSVVARPVPGPVGEHADLPGGSTILDDGYNLTVAIPCPGLEQLVEEPSVGFELVVNEMRGDRVRRAGQLVWSGRGGWVYLRGDRVADSELGTLELVE